MKKSIFKIIFIITIISLIIYIPAISKASFIGNIIDSGKDFIETPSDTNITERVDGAQIIGTTKDIYNLLMLGGIIVAAGIILVLGILMITGSVEQKAKVKEMLIPFVIGCVVVFGSLTIWRLVANVASSI